MNTIATLLDPAKLAQLMELAAQAGAPANVAVPTELLDAACELCGIDLKIAPPILGTIACVECAKAKAKGATGRRYVKVNHPPRTSATPQELSRVGRIDLSNYSDGELGQLVRKGLLGVTVSQIRDVAQQPELTPEQARKVAALMDTLGWKRADAVAHVTGK